MHWQNLGTHVIALHTVYHDPCTCIQVELTGGGSLGSFFTPSVFWGQGLPACCPHSQLCGRCHGESASTLYTSTAHCTLLCMKICIFFAFYHGFFPGAMLTSVFFVLDRPLSLFNMSVCISTFIVKLFRKFHHVIFIFFMF